MQEKERELKRRRHRREKAVKLKNREAFEAAKKNPPAKKK